MNIYEQINQKGIDLFINPQKVYSYEELIWGANVKGKRMTVLSSNTYRGFHRIDKSKPGAKYYFDKCLIQCKDLILKTLYNNPDEKEINKLGNEIDNDLRVLLKTNVSEEQLKSFNKTRKPIDIVMEHFIAMLKDFNSNSRNTIVPNLYLPLDSQMFQSSYVFSYIDIKRLRLRRQFTFKDIGDKNHYYDIQGFLKEKASNLGLISRVFFDLFWKDRYMKTSKNLFEASL